MPLIREAGETPDLVIARTFQAASLWSERDVRAAHEVALDALAIAERLGDGRARAYARSTLVFMRSVLGLDSLEAADRMKSEMTYDCLHFGDSYIRNWSLFYLAWDFFYRGLMKEAREQSLLERKGTTQDRSG